MSEIEQSVKAIRKWQRHHLLREYGENGHVLPENLELSQHIDAVLSRLERDSAEIERLQAALSREQLHKLLYEEIKADIECEADAENAYQEGYAEGFNDCRARTLNALLRVASALDHEQSSR